MQDKTRERWFYVPLPKAMGEEIDRILDKHGGEMSIFTRNEFVRSAVREKMDKIREREEVTA